LVLFAKNERSIPCKKLKLVSCLINGFVFSCWIGIIIADFATLNPMVHLVETIFSTCLSLVAGFCSLFFGLRLRAKLMNSAMGMRSAITQKILFTTLISSSVFILRGILIVTSWYISERVPNTPWEVIMFNMIWWIFIELAPTLGIILVMDADLRSTHKTPDKFQHVSRNINRATTEISPLLPQTGVVSVNSH